MKWSELELWLDGLSFISGDVLVRDSLLRKIRQYRELHSLHTSETPLCRHCLIKMGMLVATDDDAEKALAELLKAYDFSGAIIC